MAVWWRPEINNRSWLSPFSGSPGGGDDSGVNRVRSLKFLLLSALVFISIGAVFLIQEVEVLQVVNADRGRYFQVKVKPGSRFTLSYINSIYLEPAAEDFEVGTGEEIILKGVRTKSLAVAHYYGFEEGREYYPVNRKMKSFSLRVGMSIPQTLDCGNRKVSLQEVGEKGDRVEVRVVRMTLAHYLLSRF